MVVPFVARSFEECHWRFGVVNQILLLLGPFQRRHRPREPRLPKNKRKLFTVIYPNRWYLVVCHGLELSDNEWRRDEADRQANLQVRVSFPNRYQLNLITNVLWKLLFGVRMNEVKSGRKTRRRTKSHTKRNLEWKNRRHKKKNNIIIIDHVW